MSGYTVHPKEDGRWLVLNSAMVGVGSFGRREDAAAFRDMKNGDGPPVTRIDAADERTLIVRPSTRAISTPVTANADYDGDIQLTQGSGGSIWLDPPMLRALANKFAPMEEAPPAEPPPAASQPEPSARATRIGYYAAILHSSGEYSHHTTESIIELATDIHDLAAKIVDGSVTL